MVKDMDKGERPGRELPKDYREVATELVDNQGWRYSTRNGNYPALYPPDRSQSPVVLARTPSDQRAFRNFVSLVRQRGGQWPPPRKGK